MSSDPRSQLQEVIAGRSTMEAKKPAPPANIVNFQNWVIYGLAPTVYVQVDVTPTQSNVDIQYVALVIQMPNGDILSDTALTSNAQAGWALSITAETGIYNVSQYGSSVQVWAYAQGTVDGQQQSQYSAVQSYTVSSS